MTSSAYAKLLLCGTLSSFIALACTVTTGDGDGDFGPGGTGGGNSGGATGGSKAGGTGGKSTGGAAMGGATGTMGGSAAGGATAAGGAGTGGAEAVMCNDAGTRVPTTTIAMCDPNSDNPCKKCIAEKCCTQFEACNGGSPKTPCGYGAPDGMGEALCIQACVLKLGFGADEASFTECRTKCQTTACTKLDPATDTLINCLNPGTTPELIMTGCLMECFQ